MAGPRLHTNRLLVDIYSDLILQKKKKKMCVNCFLSTGRDSCLTNIDIY